MSHETQWFSFTELVEKVQTVLQHGGLNAAQAEATAHTLVTAEQDQCYSHGLYRIEGIFKTLASKMADGQALPTVSDVAGQALVKVNAHGGFSSLAFNTGLPLLIKKARQFGLAAMAINDCVHYSALWVEVEQLAQAGMAGLAMCPTAAYVAPSGGISKLLGTNPFAFAWPCTQAEPYVFDFATSAAARGAIELRQRQNQPIPADWAIDDYGQPTTDAAAGLNGALLPFGGHKGSALATMIELLAGVWIDDLLSLESSERDQERLLAPRHGELILALNPAAFGATDLTAHSHRLLDAITAQGARLPSQRRFAARQRAQQKGIAIRTAMLQQLDALVAQTTD
ncbi:Ldh family oxidoreductase [Neisseriaceae bacterium ESL0693]|nr:Ldh family oxidoreductase [Neisseriaceae bacterium ESL0693]